MTVQEYAIMQVVRAIKDEGANPPFHRAVMERHRSEWPHLWFALDQLCEVAP